MSERHADVRGCAHAQTHSDATGVVQPSWCCLSDSRRTACVGARRLGFFHNRAQLLLSKLHVLQPARQATHGQSSSFVGQGSPSGGASAGHSCLHTSRPTGLAFSLPCSPVGGAGHASGRHDLDGRGSGQSKAGAVQAAAPSALLLALQLTFHACRRAPPVWLSAWPVNSRRGPTSVPSSTACARPQSAPPQSRTVVNPRASMPSRTLP